MSHFLSNEADNDIQAGRKISFNSVDEMLKGLHLMSREELKISCAFTEIENEIKNHNDLAKKALSDYKEIELSSISDGLRLALEIFKKHLISKPN
jgi:hypothetical protein